MPYGTNVTSLVPTITVAGSSVSPSSGTAVNFATPQTYTVTSVDEATTQSYTVTVSVNIGITASAGANGSITPSGTVDVTPGTDKIFTITPDENYHVADVLVDGASVGAVASYTFSNVTAAHTISASCILNNNTNNAATDLPKTGQTLIYSSGDDGYLQAGTEWPAPRFADQPRQ